LKRNNFLKEKIDNLKGNRGLLGFIDVFLIFQGISQFLGLR